MSTTYTHCPNCGQPFGTAQTCSACGWPTEKILIGGIEFSRGELDRILDLIDAHVAPRKPGVLG